MKDNKRLWVMFCLAAMVLIFFAGIAAGSENITVEGTIINYQLAADDGQIYEIAVNEVGDQLVELADTRVRVSGFVEDEDGIKVFTVSSYEVVKDNS